MSKEELGIFNDDYIHKTLMDKNKFFRIYEAKTKKEKRQCCLKIIDKEILKSKNYINLKNFIENEINLTELCNSDNTINFYGRKESSKSIIFEFDKYGEDLFKFMEENVNFKDEEDQTFFKQIIQDLTKGLKAIHKKGVIHRNIQPSSIFIIEIEEGGEEEEEEEEEKEEEKKEEEKKRIIKIGEFGNAILKKDNKFKQIGNLFYAAPEIIQNKEYDEKCDLWSLGITLYESYFEHLPYGVNVNKNIIMNTLCDYYNGKGFIFEKTGKASLDILFNCLLQIEPEKRINTDELYNLVFDEDFMENDDNFLNKNEKYKNIYNDIKKEVFDNERYISEDIKEGNNKEVRKEQNLKKIIAFAMEDNLNDIMDFPNSQINNDEKINNLLYYDDNKEFLDIIIKNADSFEQNTSGAFILCTDMTSLKLIREEILSIFETDRSITFSLITTGSKFEEIYKFINENKTFRECIKNICIYCKDLEKWSPLKNKYNDDIEGVYNKPDDIINFIEKFSSKKAYPLTRLINYKNYKNFYKERHIKIASYYGELDSQLYEQNITKIKSLIEEDTLNSSESDKKMKSFESFSLDEKIEALDEIIITEYTKNEIYKDLNKWLRDFNLKKNYYEVVSYFTARLIYSLNKYATEKNAFEKTNGKILRRGVKMFYSNILPYIRNKREIIALTSFTSTTEKEDTANFFAGRKDKNLYKNTKNFSVIFIITNNYKEGWISNAINIQNSSDKKHEGEILLLPFSFYKVQDVIIDTEKHTADIYLETIGKKEILEEKIKEGKLIRFNYIENIMEIEK